MRNREAFNARPVVQITARGVMTITIGRIARRLPQPHTLGICLVKEAFEFIVLSRHGNSIPRIYRSREAVIEMVEMPPLRSNTAYLICSTRSRPWSRRAASRTSSRSMQARRNRSSSVQPSATTTSGNPLTTLFNVGKIWSAMPTQGHSCHQPQVGIRIPVGSYRHAPLAP